MKIKILAICCLFLLLFSCKKESTVVVDPNINFQAVLTGGAEVPAVTTTASGAATGVYNSDTKILTLTITYSGLTVTAGNVHKGSVTENGVAVFPLPVSASPITYRSTALPADKEADLLAGNYYINLRTSANPFGEIRGQLLKK